MGAMWTRWNEIVDANEASRTTNNKCQSQIINITKTTIPAIIESSESSSEIRSKAAFPTLSCKECNNTLPLRPNVLLFNDTDENVLSAIQHHRNRYQEWEAKVEDELVAAAAAAAAAATAAAHEEVVEEKGELVVGKNFVLIEIGCGRNVPAVRNESEEVLRDCNELLLRARASGSGSSGSGSRSNINSSSSITLIRINPKHAGIDGDNVNDDEEIKLNVVSIYDTALNALQLIDGALNAMMMTTTSHS